MSDAAETTRDWASAARAWWRALQPYDDQGRPNWTSDRGALARLRRASLPADALVEPAVLNLYRLLGFRGLSGDRLALTVVAAMTLAHVRPPGGKTHPAASVGRVSFEDKQFETAAMKPMRFQRLLSARSAEELARQMRRLVQVADHEIDVGKLAADILTWRDDEVGDRTRTRWAYEYLAVGRDAPDEPGSAPAPLSPSPQ